MITKLFHALLTDHNILFFDEDSGNVTFSSDELGIISLDLNNNNLDDANFYYYDPKNIIQVRILVWHNNLEVKYLKKSLSRN